MTGPVLYLHGFGSSPASSKARFFAEQFQAQGVDVCIPQLDEGAFEQLTISGQLAVVARELDRTGATNVLGSSLGGYLAALAAARHPKIERVMCMAPAFDFAARWRAWIGEEAMKEWESSGRLDVFHYGEGRAAQVGWDLYRDALGYEAYPLVSQPTLIFHGRKDEVVPIAVSEEFVRRNPPARLQTLDSDHELLDVTGLMWEQTWQFLSR